LTYRDLAVIYGGPVKPLIDKVILTFDPFRDRAGTALAS